jgi:hypothetical protein
VLLLGAAGQIVASRDQGQSFTALPMKTRFPVYRRHRRAGRRW